MLSRRHLRIKVLLALYAFKIAENDRLDVGEKELFKSLNKLYEIYIYQLSLLVEIVEFASKRQAENKQKFFPTEEDLNPNTRFVENRFIKQLVDNKDYQKLHKAYKINWSGEEDMIRKLYSEIKSSTDFLAYSNEWEPSYKNDKEILVKILKKHLGRSDSLHFYFEEKNIYWSDDFYTANTFAMKTIKNYAESWDADKSLPSLYKFEEHDNEEEDINFVKNLFRKSIVKSEEYEKIIENKVQNWEMDRIAIMDIIILKMALVELLEFPSIPVKVSMNEYIDLAKMYSTPKSKIFVNGILDKIIADLKASKKIKKVGRGLLES